MNVTKVVPFSFKDLSIRTIQVDGEPYFVAIDICKALGFKSPESALRKLDEDEKLRRKIYASGQRREIIVCNESGLYHLIFKSRKPEAKAFRKWVTSEVLPALRKTGRYQAARPAMGGQLRIFEDEYDAVVLEQVKREMLSVALSSRPNSKVGRLIRLLEPVIYGKTSK